MEVVVKNKGFIYKNIKIPPFELKRGQMVKIYVPNFSNYGGDIGYEYVKELQVQILKHHFRYDMIQINETLFSSKFLFKNKLSRFLTLESCFDYIQKNITSNVDEINLLLRTFKLNGKQKIKKLFWAEEKSLAVIAGLKKYDNIFFDYYGLPGLHYTELSLYIIKNLIKNKSILAFDRLEYMEETEISDKIKRVIVQEL